MPDPQTPTAFVPDRDRRDLWWCVLLVALVLVPLVVSAFYLWFGVGSDYLPTVDWALFELQTRDALDHGVWVGPYSRFGWNHPGPMLFYALAVPYKLLGSRSVSMHIAALGVNAATLAAIGWVAYRRGRLAMVIIVLVPVALLARTLGADALRDPWNPYLPVLPLLLLLLLALVDRGGRRVDAPDRDPGGELHDPEPRRARGRDGRVAARRTGRGRHPRAADRAGRAAGLLAPRGQGDRGGDGRVRRRVEPGGLRDVREERRQHGQALHVLHRRARDGRDSPPRSRCSACSGDRSRSGCSARAGSACSATRSSSRSGGSRCGSCSGSGPSWSRCAGAAAETVWLAVVTAVGLLAAAFAVSSIVGLVLPVPEPLDVGARHRARDPRAPGTVARRARGETRRRCCGGRCRSRSSSWARSR